MTTLQIIEGTPASWPDWTVDLSIAAQRIDLEAVWRRLEGWIAWRWGPRPCTFIVEGRCGLWRAPLTPFVSEAVEEWAAEDWRAVGLSQSPLGGFVLGSADHYRLTGTLGSADAPPADVMEAFRRLAEYFGTAEINPGASSYAESIGDLRLSAERDPAWLARAMQYSGAADLLRRYRRAP